MILVTGASGKTGRTIISNLSKKRLSVRAWVRRPETIISGAKELFVGDMQSESDWGKAVRGVQKIYHICPNMHPNEVEIGKMAIHAAAKADLNHFVYHSVLHPQIQSMPHHWNKMLVEELLFESGVLFTILQPTAYMQNLLPQWEKIKQDKILSLPYPAESRISLVDLNDVAQAVSIILTSDQFFGAILELVGTGPISQTEVAQILSKKMGQAIEFQEVNLHDWESANMHLPDYSRNTLLAMFRYYAKHGLVGNRSVLKMILKQEPNSLENWVLDQK